MTGPTGETKDYQELRRIYEERVESVPDWLWEVDLECIVTYSNRVVEDIIGYSSSEMIGKAIVDFVIPEDLDRCRRIFTEAKERKEPIKNVLGHFLTKEGAVKMIEMSCVPMCDAEGELIGFRGIGRDVTEIVAEQTAARELQANYKALVENSPTGILIVQNERVAYVNPTIGAIMGYEPEEAVGREIWEFLHPDDVGWLKERYRRRMDGEELLPQFEARAITKSGEVRYFDYRVSRITYNDAPALLLNAVDVTERKKALESLEETKEKFRNLAENTSDWVWEVDENWIYAYASPRIKDLLGYEPEEVIGKTPFDLMSPEEAKRVCEEFARVEEKRAPFSLLENTLVHKDGHEVVVETSGTPIFDEAGVYRGYRGIDRDITERKRAREELERRTSELEAILHAFPDLYFWVDAERRIIDYHAIRVEDLYVPPDQFLGRKFSDVLPPDVARDIEAAVAATLESGTPKALEYPLRMRERDKFFEARIVPLFKDQVLAIVRDITDRKKADEVLRDERNFASAVVDTVGALVVVLDRDGRIVRFNRACEQTTGYSFKEVEGSYLWDRLLLPEETEEVKAVVEDLRAGHFPSRHENYWVTKTGERRLIAWSNTALADTAGVVTYFIGTGIDITERRRAQQALQEAEAKYRSLVEESLVGVYIIQDGSFSYVNPRFAEIFGYTQEEMTAEITALDIAAPESRELVRENLRKRFAGEVKSIHYTYKGVRKDGAEIDVEVLGSRTIYQGKPAIIGSLLDITERRKSEDAIRSSEERFRLLFEHSPDMVFLLRDNLFTAINPAVTRILGYEPGEIIGRAPWDISPKHQPDKRWSREKALDVLKAVPEKGPLTFEWVCLHKEGRNVDCEVSLARYKIHEEENVQAIVRDVTERKQAEENRRKLERELEAQKRQFYRDTILSVTEGKLDIRDRAEMRKYVANAQETKEVNQPSQVGEARHEMEDFCRRRGLSGERLESFMIGVGEAITNAIKHGRRGRVHAGSNARSVWVGVSDRGRGIESLILPRATLLRGFSTKPSLGLGYSIMIEVADQVLLSTERRGTIVVLVKSIEEEVISLEDVVLPDTWNNIPP